MTTLHRLTIASMVVLTGLLSGCATVSFDQPKSHSIAITDTDDTALGKYADHIAATHAGASGFYPLDQGMDALGVRLRLAEKATKSIDLQYFLMKSDTAGAVMANALLKAADRGVRVRFLLDDVFTNRSLLTSIFWPWGQSQLKYPSLSTNTGITHHQHPSSRSSMIKASKIWKRFEWTSQKNLTRSMTPFMNRHLTASC